MYSQSPTWKGGSEENAQSQREEKRLSYVRMQEKSSLTLSTNQSTHIQSEPTRSSASFLTSDPTTPTILLSHQHHSSTKTHRLALSTVPGFSTRYIAWGPSISRSKRVKAGAKGRSSYSLLFHFHVARCLFFFFFSIPSSSIGLDRSSQSNRAHQARDVKILHMRIVCSIRTRRKGRMREREGV